MATTQESNSDDTDDLVHEWLLAGDYSKNHPAEVQIEVRDFIEDLPDTKATFARSEPVEDHPDLTYHGVRDEHMLHVGSWPVPDLDSQNRDRWVNPNHPNAIRFTDAVVVCDCGTRMTRMSTAGHAVFDDDFDHAEDCTQQQKYQAKADLCMKRAEIMHQTARMGNPISGNYERLGLANTPHGGMYKPLGVDANALKKEYHERRLNTVLRLLDEMPTKRVARVYGVTPSYIATMVGSETPHTLNDFARGTNGN
jgi:hypothetical protein